MEQMIAAVFSRQSWRLVQAENKRPSKSIGVRNSHRVCLKMPNALTVPLV
jgi:hypothetical protein